MEAYFTVESISRKSAVTFQTLRTRLVAAVNVRMRNGEFTERGLAKILGVSQPHMHNVLKGTRTLQWELADRFIADLGIKMLDLWTDEELAVDARVQPLIEQSPIAAHGKHRDPDLLPRKQPAPELGIWEARRGRSAARV